MEPNPNRLTELLTQLDARIDWERLDRGAMRAGLGPIEGLVSRLEHPQRAARVVHIAGTKGKGSVAAYVAAGLGASNGVYASPHVSRIQERIRVNGEEVGDELFANALKQVLAAAQPECTWFDLMTATAFCVFRAAKVEWAVMEVGLGGRLDSTNVVEPEVCAITSIDLEHTDVLGDTHAAIAGEKAGILKAGVPCVVGVGQESEAGEVIARRADELGCPITWVPRAETLRATNRAIASAILEVLGRPAEIPEVCLPGRLERGWVGDVPVLMDGAHVASSLEAVLGEAEALGYRGRPICVLGMGSDKDAPALLKALRERVDRVHCTSVGSRQRAPEELAALAADQGLEAHAMGSPEDAVTSAAAAVGSAGWVLVTGSLHLVGAVRGSVVTTETTQCSPSAPTSSSPTRSSSKGT